jgi:hypothetical protein
MDVHHPVNVVEGKDSIVMQVGPASAVIHSQALSTSLITFARFPQIVGGGVTKSGKKYQFDCLFIFRFNEQQKIVSVDEFVVRASSVLSWGSVLA